MSGVEWTAEAWAARLASGNPVFPYEWAVLYTSGARFKRVCHGIMRTSRAAPLFGIRALRITGPSLAVEIPAPPGPVRRIVIAATIVGHLGREARPGVAAWRFGLEDPAGVWGIVLDPAGRVTPMRPLEAAGNGRGGRMKLVLVGTVALGLLCAACDWQQDQAGSVSGPGISIHCDAAVPGGDTTTKVVCPGAQ